MEFKRTYTAIGFLLLCAILMAQTPQQPSLQPQMEQIKTPQPIIEIKSDKKVYHIDQWDLPSNTTISDVLEMIPELQNRASDFRWANYTIRMDGKDVGDGRDVILKQTRIGDVKSIEISDSPSASEQKKGQGGIINIVPKNMEEGFHGSTMLDASSLFDVMPSAVFLFKKDKWTLRTGLYMEYYNHKQWDAQQYFTPGQELYIVDSTHTKFTQETVLAQMKYKDEHSEWKVHFRETYSASSQDLIQNGSLEKEMEKNVYQRTVGADYKNSQNKKFNLCINTEYKYTFDNKNEIKVEGEYGWNPNKTGSYIEYSPTLQPSFGYQIWQANNNSAQPHRGNLQAQTKLYAYNKDKTHFLFFKTGINTTFTSQQTFLVDSCLKSGVAKPLIKAKSDWRYQTQYVSPFFEAEWTEGIWYLQASVRYQYYKYTITESDSLPLVVPQHDVTGNMSVKCSINDENVLRLRFARDLMRPSATQLYPYTRYNVVTNSYSIGNKLLKPATTSSFELLYDNESTVGEHGIITNLGFKYLYANNLIQSSMRTDTVNRIVYTTWENGGKSHILNLNANVIYHYGIFTLSFSGSVYDRMQPTADGKLQSYYYFNLGLSPMFKFQDDWSLTAKVLYNSKVRQANYTMGDCLCTQLNVSKKWQNFVFFAQVQNSFGYLNKDVQKSDNTTTYKIYNLYPSEFNCGFEYRF